MNRRRARGISRACLPVLLALAGCALADDEVSFDRPGLGFGPDALPRGGFIWEQGLPSFERDTLAGGERETQYSPTRCCAWGWAATGNCSWALRPGNGSAVALETTRRSIAAQATRRWA